MEHKLVWFVASVYVPPKKSQYPLEVRRASRNRSPRTWCFFWTKEEAVDYVLSAVYLLSGGHYYSHAVIEAHGAGDIAMAEEDIWFRLDVGKHLSLGKRGPDYVEPVDVAVPVDKPEELKNVVNFCLG
jgi:hypothetical protein